MPWSPDFRDVPDARLDPYRDRMAALYRSGALAGHVLVLTERWAFRRGGHLWWRRWEPDRELAQPLVQLLDGTEFDHPVHEAHLEPELEQWSRGEFALLGELFDMVWLSQEEALHLAPEVFGLSSCLDDDDRVIWSWTPGGPEATQTG